MTPDDETRLGEDLSALRRPVCVVLRGTVVA